MHVAYLRPPLQGAVTVVRAPHFAALRCSPGMVSWRVPDPSAIADDDSRAYYDEVADVPPALLLPRGALRPTMFATQRGGARAHELAQTMRVYPHHNDTGGFFVALLTKSSHTEAAPMRS